MRLPYVLAFVVACVSQSPDEDADETSTEEQAIGWRGGRDAPGEIIHVEGDAPGGRRSDPWWGPGPGRANGGGAREGGVTAGSRYVVMDPEPDRYKDRKSCEDWCDWSMRQCVKWCTKQHPWPDWDGYNQCLKNRCQKDPDPDIGQDACRADCQRRFPERW
jgi:hypothetical protein